MGCTFNGEVLELVVLLQDLGLLLLGLLGGLVCGVGHYGGMCEDGIEVGVNKVGMGFVGDGWR